MSVDTSTAIAAVSLEEAKAHLRVDEDADDALIDSLCLAATQMAEHELQRPLVTREGSEGYGEASDVPAAIKQWIKLQVGYMYEERAATAEGAVVERPGIGRLLDPYRTWL